MRVAITGASGFIGTALGRSLRADNHTVVPVSRRHGDGIAWDPVAGTIDARAFEGVDAVVHLAGEGIATKRWTAAQKELIHDSRVSGTSLIAATLAAMTHPPRVLVSGSATGYYGERGSQVLTESFEPGADFLAEVCIDWEDATAPASDAGITVSHLRTGIVLGRDGGMLKRILLLYKLALGGRLGGGHQYMSWISLVDQVRAMRWLVDNPSRGAFNLTAPEPVTNREFSKSLAKAVKRPAVIPVPKFAPKALLGSELANGLLFNSIRAVPERLLAAGFEFEHDQIASALASIVSR